MSQTCRHYWTETEDGRWACADCAETCAACMQCQRWTGGSLLICDRCVRWVRGILDDLETAIALYLPTPRSAVPAIRYDRDRITGTYGDDEDATRWSLRDVEVALADWAGAWAEASDKVVTIDPVDFLRGHILWAAHHAEDSDWVQWLAEMRKALAVAKCEAGILPKRMPAPCAHCGGMAVQTWADKRLRPHTHGLSDEVTCLGCGLTWRSAGHYEQVSKDHLQRLPEDKPDTVVTLDEAALVWPDIPVKTWATWLRRGELPDAVAWDVRAQPQYRVGDLDVLAQRRVDQTRRGRRAG